MNTVLKFHLCFVAKGEKRDALVYLHDLSPTLCELSGLDIPKGIETKSVAPIIKDKSITM